MKKIMLAEDDATMLSLLRTLLTMEGFQVSVLDVHKEDLLASIRSERPDVLLMDVHLPHQNGMALLRDLRQVPELKGMRVILTSGMALEEESLFSGADAFLLKPYMPDDLLNMLRDMTSTEG